MSSINQYTITQTRQIRICALNENDALLIANLAFTNGQESNQSVKDFKNELSDVWGNPISHAKMTNVTINREN